MLDRRVITFQHWQPMIGRNLAAPASALGQIVHGLGDVEQSIRTIALTEKGSVPTEPEKCVELKPYIDRRPAWAIPYITRELFDGITAFEPRVVVAEVRISFEDYEHARFPVFWYPRGDVLREIRQTVIQMPDDRRRGIIHAA